MAHEGQKIKGKLWQLQLKEGAGSYLTVICEKDMGINQSTAVTDANSKCGEDSAPGNKTRTIAGTGYLIQEPNVGATEASLKELQAWFEASTSLLFKFGKITPATGDLVYSGNAWISQLDVTANTEDYIQFSFTGQLSAVVLTETP